MEYRCIVRVVEVGHLNGRRHCLEEPIWTLQENAKRKNMKIVTLSFRWPRSTCKASQRKPDAFVLHSKRSCKSASCSWAEFSSQCHLQSCFSLALRDDLGDHGAPVDICDKIARKDFRIRMLLVPRYETTSDTFNT
mmetsp:Transcript_58101/g.154748  ORF Transcript_58101/g.154748 Transcript_58101/m.154748 type:complete len:136 (+) Transcript_58101:3-410(+)